MYTIEKVLFNSTNQLLNNLTTIVGCIFYKAHSRPRMHPIFLKKRSGFFCRCFFQMDMFWYETFLIYDFLYNSSLFLSSSSIFLFLRTSPFADNEAIGYYIWRLDFGAEKRHTPPLLSLHLQIRHSLERHKPATFRTGHTFPFQTPDVLFFEKPASY